MANHDSSTTGQGDDAKVGKKGPTPKRREREAANFRPLVPEDRKQARRESQAKVREEQAKARAGMAAGDDRYLRPGERGPQKRFLRDFIDSRFTLGELLIPAMFLVIFATMLPQETNASVYAMFAIWAYLALCIIEGIALSLLARRRVQAVVGAERTEKGFVMQGLARSMQMRFLRMPRAQVKRFSKVEFTGGTAR